MSELSLEERILAAEAAGRAEAESLDAGAAITLQQQAQLNKDKRRQERAAEKEAKKRAKEEAKQEALRLLKEQTAKEDAGDGDGCASCGYKKNKPNAKFCKKCGAARDSDAAEADMQRKKREEAASLASKLRSPRGNQAQEKQRDQRDDKLSKEDAQALLHSVKLHRSPEKSPRSNRDTGVSKEEALKLMQSVAKPVSPKTSPRNVLQFIGGGESSPRAKSPRSVSPVQSPRKAPVTKEEAARLMDMVSGSSSAIPTIKSPRKATVSKEEAAKLLESIAKSKANPTVSDPSKNATYQFINGGDTGKQMSRETQARIDALKELIAVAFDGSHPNAIEEGAAEAKSLLELDMPDDTKVALAALKGFLEGVPDMLQREVGKRSIADQLQPLLDAV